jgi:hypothetical protein
MRALPAEHQDNHTKVVLQIAAFLILLRHESHATGKKDDLMYDIISVLGINMLAGIALFYIYLNPANTCTHGAKS